MSGGAGRQLEMLCRQSPKVLPVYHVTKMQIRYISCKSAGCRSLYICARLQPKKALVSAIGASTFDIHLNMLVW